MSDTRTVIPPKSAPAVSIIMGAYNAEATIRDSIDSIINQQFTDWEFVICDDGSTDRTLPICREYAAAYPDRFRILANAENLQLSATLNRCLGVARGRYIARMDADDVSLPARLLEQIRVLESQPTVDIVGTAMQRFDQTGPGALVVPPPAPDRDTLRREVPFCHATIVARREVYEKIGGYNESRRTARAEDLELWFEFYRLALVGINLRAPLYLVREDVAAIRRRTLRVRWNVFRTTLVGYRKLRYPVYCYVFPCVQLGKALVPHRVQQLYRNWQAKHASKFARRVRK